MLSQLESGTFLGYAAVAFLTAGGYLVLKDLRRLWNCIPLALLGLSAWAYGIGSAKTHDLKPLPSNFTQDDFEFQSLGRKPCAVRKTDKLRPVPLIVRKACRQTA